VPFRAARGLNDFPGLSVMHALLVSLLPVSVERVEARTLGRPVPVTESMDHGSDGSGLAGPSPKTKAKTNGREREIRYRGEIAGWTPTKQSSSNTIEEEVLL
jgi:hypothetical protein